MSEPTRQDAFEAVAQSLREFGYPDAFAKQVADVWDAMKAGKRDEDLPHGIIGRFAFSQLDENKDWIEKLP